MVEELKLTSDKELEVLSSNLQYFPRGLDDINDYLTIKNRTSIEILGNYLFYYYDFLWNKHVCVIFFMKGKGLKSLYSLYKHLMLIEAPIIYTGHSNVFPKHSKEIGKNLYKLIKEN